MTQQKPFSWSFSAMSLFNQCAQRYALQHVDRVPYNRVENQYAERGIQVHSFAEDYVNGKTEVLAADLQKFKPMFNAARREFKKGLACVEQEWGFDRNWEPIDFKQGWVRMLADLVVFKRDKTRTVIVDYKTGKRWGNELKHGEQGMLYVASAAVRSPETKHFDFELWYLDLNDLVGYSYTRDDAMDFKRDFSDRAATMEARVLDKDFPPTPSVKNCKYCPFARTEHCNVAEFAVSANQASDINATDLSVEQLMGLK